MKKSIFVLLFVTVALFGTYRFASSHCEIPCGIYGDSTRITILYEHCNTIEKSMAQINVAAKKDSPNWNQLVRWVGNKEKHADEIQHIVTQYFMTQRIKPTADKYVEKLTTLHKMLIHAMKAKQTTDPSHVTQLRALIADFSKLYFTATDLKHIKEHHPEGK